MLPRIHLSDTLLLRSKSVGALCILHQCYYRYYFAQLCRNACFLDLTNYIYFMLCRNRISFGGFLIKKIINLLQIYYSGQSKPYETLNELK